MEIELLKFCSLYLSLEARWITERLLCRLAKFLSEVLLESMNNIKRATWTCQCKQLWTCQCKHWTCQCKQLSFACTVRTFIHVSDACTHIHACVRACMREKGGNRKNAMNHNCEIQLLTFFYFVLTFFWLNFVLSKMLLKFQHYLQFLSERFVVAG